MGLLRDIGQFLSCGVPSVRLFLGHKKYPLCWSMGAIVARRFRTTTIFLIGHGTKVVTMPNVECQLLDTAHRLLLSKRARV